MDEQPPLMELNAMRALLKRAKKAPVSCAIGLGPKNVALLLMHRKRPPRALEKALKKEVPDARATRFGTASVDLEESSTLVQFVLNKPSSGMARRLIRVLKGTGFNKARVGIE